MNHINLRPKTKNSTKLLKTVVFYRGGKTSKRPGDEIYPSDSNAEINGILITNSENLSVSCTSYIEFH